MYASWENYRSLYLLEKDPVIPETDFPHYAKMASAKVDASTFGRLKREETFELHKDEVSLCVCELAEFLFTTNDQRGLSSVSVTGHSMSFDKKQNKQDIREIITRYLGDTGLLFSGVE